MNDDVARDVKPYSAHRAERLARFHEARARRGADTIVSDPLALAATLRAYSRMERALREAGVVYATVRDAVREDGEDVLHIECRFANGEKYAPIVIDAGHDALAQVIATFLSRAREGKE